MHSQTDSVPWQSAVGKRDQWIHHSKTRKIAMQMKSQHDLKCRTSHVQYQLTLKSASRDNRCTVGGDGGCRVGEVRAGTTSPMPDHKGFKLR